MTPNELQESIKKIIKGDQKAFESIVEAYQQYAFGLSYRILCDEEEARDNVQDAFIKIWKKIKSYKLSMKFENWLSKVVVNTAIDRLRVIQRQQQVSIEAVSESLTALSDPGFQNVFENEEIGNWIRLLAGKLPEKQRIIFILRDIQGMSSMEVQEVMELTETMVKSNLYHARKAVALKLEQIIDYERK